MQNKKGALWRLLRFICLSDCFSAFLGSSFLSLAVALAFDGCRGSLFLGSYANKAEFFPHIVVDGFS
jgi:hypothetical protein